MGKSRSKYYDQRNEKCILFAKSKTNVQLPGEKCQGAKSRAQ